MATSERSVDTDVYTAIRGLASLIVASEHALWLGTRLGHGCWFPGNHSVLIFFVMSGIVTTLAYAPMATSGRLISKVFYARRAARIIPMYWVGLSCCIAIQYLFASYHNVGLAQFVAGNFVSYSIYVLFMQGWFPVEPFTRLGTVSLWTVSIVVFSYLMFPHLIALIDYRRSFTRLALEASGWCLAFVIGRLITSQGYTFAFAQGYLQSVPPGTSPRAASYMSSRAQPIHEVCLFVLGMVLGSHLLQLRKDGTAATNRARWKAAADALSVSVAIVWMASIMLDLGGSVDCNDHEQVVQRIWTELTMPSLYAAWLYALVRAEKCRASCALSWRPLVFLGERSFSLYVLQEPLIHVYLYARLGAAHFFALPGGWAGPPTGLHTWEVPIMVSLFVAASSSCHQAIERPMRTRLSRVLLSVLAQPGPSLKLLV